MADHDNGLIGIWVAQANNPPPAPHPAVPGPAGAPAQHPPRTVAVLSMIRTVELLLDILGQLPVGPGLIPTAMLQALAGVIDAICAMVGVLLLPQPPGLPGQALDGGNAGPQEADSARLLLLSLRQFLQTVPLEESQGPTIRNAVTALRDRVYVLIPQYLPAPEDDEDDNA
ncbi:uncharacterized protein LOC129588570 isoform X2 [Paramacrobiotus metropolitanus]|uniref:uncharacterized protein LOC129588570 isoform X2 n=1 Tax=Paramacrobiotus metropolitanus TaxID=2943436 RepID=UPI002445E763|nr:uncharacterized protein LOC129588570 isoform X2 [Paramacrobiotus metropolitanus]